MLFCLFDLLTMDDLYRELILDHYHYPRNFGSLKKPDAAFEMNNPFCGDEIRVEVKQIVNSKQQTVLHQIAFSGQGCAISIASASLLTEYVKDKQIQDLRRLTKDDIVKLLLVPLTPIRLKCALLSLEVLQKALVLLQNHGRSNSK